MSVPKLRFKEFQGKWSVSCLNNYLYENILYNSDNEYNREDVLSVSGEYGLVNQMYFQGRSFAADDVSRYHIVKDKDIVYTKSPLKASPYGIVKTSYDKYGIVSPLYAIYHCFDNADNRFVEQYFANELRLNKYLKPIVNMGAKNTMQVRNDDVLGGKVLFPRFAEQKKIADFLTNFDKRIATQQNIIADLEETKKGLLQKIFSQELRFKDANGQDYPDWEEKRLVAISELITVGIANSATHAYTENGVVMFRNLNIKPNELDELDIIHISTEFAQKYEKKKLQENDILVCRTGYPGTACIVPKKYSGAQTFTTLIVRLNHAEADVKYVCQYINSDIGKKYFESTQIGGGQKNSGAGILSKMPIKIPCMEEQRKIADFLSTFDKKITAEKQILSDLQEIKKGLLQQMFV